MAIPQYHFKNRTGEKHGRWTILRIAPVWTARYPRWICRCDCGTERVVLYNALQYGRSKSCGCYFQERKHHLRYKHGMSYTPVYRVWQGIVKRCTNSRDPNFINYGGRGIGVCERWRDFRNFFADMGNRPAGLTIERVDNDDGYHPQNCKWATNAEQQRNRRQKGKVIK